MKLRTIYFNQNSNGEGGAEYDSLGFKKDASTKDTKTEVEVKKEEENLEKNIINKETEKEKSKEKEKEKEQSQESKKPIEQRFKDKTEEENFLKSIENKSIEEITDEEKEILKYLNVELSSETSNTDLNKELWDNVNKLLGEENVIEEVIKQNPNLDINSSEGVVKVIESITERKLKAVESNLAKLAPKAWQALQLELKGEDASFIYDTKFNNELLFSKLEKDVTSEDVLERIVSESFKEKGLSDKVIQTLIQASKDKGELFELAIDEQKSLLDLESNEKNNKLNLIKQKEQEILNKQLAIEEKFDKIFSNNEISNFVLPNKLKEDFKNFVYDVVEFNDKGEPFIIQPLDINKLDNHLQYLLFQFKEGNLNDLVQKEVAKKRVLTLKRSADKDRNLGSNNEVEQNKDKKVNFNLWKELGI